MLTLNDDLAGGNTCCSQHRLECLHASLGSILLALFSSTLETPTASSFPLDRGVEFLVVERLEALVEHLNLIPQPLQFTHMDLMCC